MLGALWLAGCGASSGVGSTDWPEPSPALWEVTATDGHKAWLFGTIHALPDGVEWRTPLVDGALAQSGVLVVEITEFDSRSASALFRDMAETPGQPPLSRRVGPADRPALHALMDKADVRDGDFARIESWAAALTLASAVRIGDPQNGVDRALLADAPVVVALESHAEQLALFDDLSQPAQSALLAGVAQEAAKNTGSELLRAWLTGNDRLMEEHANGALLANAELKAVLLTDRNASWAGRITRLIDEDRKPFVAVGASHVIGAQGLVALLEQQGYAVRRVPHTQ